ncbi:mechanosensitive ion channel family protein [Ornithinibacillus bavariensis]|uniref:MscS family protein YhdY n=1 Tax=Ornithinibacillus bavariensis TaxID=545502 RepID=A0A919X938_9BACI|nr:mechanosensitive ion channel family protein [Ornithinibacillus bavariensis]GIO27299.1 putative MscS family protein YhdY [Ornithinibacillus bavariensis]HAM81906.1 mechanosensitive ion channel protein [Ornithinibacillus sp.]
MNGNWNEFWNAFLTPWNLIDLGIAIGIFLLFLLFRKIFTKYIFAILKQFVSRSNSSLLTNILRSFERPVQWVFVILGIYAAVAYYPYLNEDNEAFRTAIKIIMIILLTWGLVRLSSTSSNLFRNINERTTINIDEILIPFLSKALQVVIIAISISVILAEFNYKIDGLVAGLGLGGLAVSLAAKDALANVVGGIVIISEKPFTIGDWIRTPSVEGKVEDITFRSTKIRTAAQALVTLPNNTLANEAITNWSKMGKRQVSFYLRIKYDTPREKIERVLERIRSLLQESNEVHPETIQVNLENYMDNGFDILIYFFTKTTDWGKYLEVREAINFKIMDILAEEEVMDIAK